MSEAVDEIMIQAQVFASAWSLVGGRFDTGHCSDAAKEAKLELEKMVRAAAPAQERIQALELEVRQLTEQIAELRHAPTPQADSQPAPLREGEWINDAGRIKWLMWRVQDLEAKLAARAPADSVLEDAARYRWIRGPVEESTRYSRWRIEYWDGPNGWQPMQRERMDSAIDAAMNKGGAA